MTEYSWPEDQDTHDAAEREDARHTQKYINPYTGREMSVAAVLRRTGPTIADRLLQFLNWLRNIRRTVGKCDKENTPVSH